MFKRLIGSECDIHIFAVIVDDMTSTLIGVLHQCVHCLGEQPLILLAPDHTDSKRTHVLGQKLIQPMTGKIRVVHNAQHKMRRERDRLFPCLSQGNPALFNRLQEGVQHHIPRAGVVHHTAGVDTLHFQVR